MRIRILYTNPKQTRFLCTLHTTWICSCRIPPWNLIFFMAIPVILAETVAVTELVLSIQKKNGWIRILNRCSSILGGIAFILIITYLVPTVVIPLTSNGEFRTWVDATAIFSYLTAGIPMILLAAFLVLSHVAMIFGMVDPGIAGYSPEKSVQVEKHLHHGI